MDGLKCKKCGSSLDVIEWEQYDKYMVYDCECMKCGRNTSIIFELVPVKEYENCKMSRYDTIFEYMRSIGEM